MPELAEVEFIRKRWNHAIGETIVRAMVHPHSRVLRGVDTTKLAKALTGAKFELSAAAAKQMLFRFSGEVWLGIHLGMTGELKLAPLPYSAGKHDHLVLNTKDHALVLTDPRMFGRVQFSIGPTAPQWWSSIAPAILSEGFSENAVAAFLQRRKRAPIKAVLLMQEQFPGIGNWMADEILWRAEIHPKRLAGSLSEKEIKALHRECRWVARQALKIIGEEFKDPPKSWLFPHRWEKGGTCPKTGAKLQHAEIGGRTTCWSPGRQTLNLENTSPTDRKANVSRRSRPAKKISTKRAPKGR